MFRRAQQRGDIYTSVYTGWYCPNCNTFYTGDELVDGRCSLHPLLTPEWLEEENYFFALSRYRDRLLTHIQAHPKFIVPSSRRAEVIAMIKHGLRDFSVSRKLKPGAPRWGVPVPGDPEQVLYVWFDALTNYLTAVGFPDDQAMFARYWPADVHVIGKDITRFHCLYWPAMLWSAGLALPQQIAVHGFLTLEGQRISKTTGNIVEPNGLVDEYGVDAVRYYLARTVSFGSDGDFTRADLLRHYNNELANDLGNLLNRVVSLVQRYRGGSIPKPETKGPLEQELRSAVEATREQAATALEAWDINGALATTWALVRRANQYLEQSEPWKLVRQSDQSERLNTVLYSAAEVTRLLAIFLAPYIPSSSNRIMEQLGLSPVAEGAWANQGRWGSVVLTRVVPGPVLFPRLGKD